MKCKYCGKEIANDSLFCDGCGHKVAASQPTQEQHVNPMALKFAQHTGGNTQTQSTPAPGNAGGHIAYQPLKSLPVANKEEKLWQVLGNTRTQHSYYTDDISEISDVDFGLALQKKLDSDGVPGRVERTRIQWDESGVSQQRLVIRPTGVKNAPMCFFVGLDRIGKYTFIEEKTVIKPPVLPATPGEPVELPKLNNKQIAFGILACIVGIALFKTSIWIALAAIAVGIVLIVSYVSDYGKLTEANLHNQKVKEEAIAWTKAWDEWENNVFLASYLADTNDIMGRIHTAFHETIERVSAELFSKKPEEVSVSTASQTDLRQAVEKRRASFR